VGGACFSDSGNQVNCIDIDPKKIEALKKGKSPIYEPGLDEILVRNIKSKRIDFTSDTAGAVGKAEIIFVAVGTPQNADGSSNLNYVIEALNQIKQTQKNPLMVVLKSTVPVGTAAKAKKIFQDAKFPVTVVSNPEFLKEGTAIGDFLRPERVIIGTESEEARNVFKLLYAPFVRSGNPILFMANESAELAKYAANTFLGMKISFINEIANVAEKVGGNVHEVRKALITDSRIGSKFLYPGCGYGGSCFPKDIQALVHLGKEIGYSLPLFEQVHEVNERQKKLLFKKIESKLGSLKNKKVAVWGLAFKPETDDMREAPSVALIEALLKAGCSVSAYDPVASHEARRIFEDRITLQDEAYACLDQADALAIVTEWSEFRNPDFDEIKKRLKSPWVFDGRNLFEPSTMKKMGFKYACIGVAENG